MKLILAVLILCLPAAAMAREQAPLTPAMEEQAEAAIRSILKDPDSAVFSDLRAYGSGDKVDVCGKVNSRNSYGGYAGASWFVVPSGNLPALIYRNSSRSANANNGIIEALCNL